MTGIVSASIRTRTDGIVTDDHGRGDAARYRHNAKEYENSDHHHDATLPNAIFFIPKVSSRPLTREMAVMPYTA
jgi:hypothetical protein